LFHEVLYSYFDQHAYYNRETLLNKRVAHGRAFQLLAAKIEEVISRLLGFQPDLRRFEGLRWKLAEGLARLPSVHDLAIYNFDNVATQQGSQDA
jgi:hypothetical protein